MVGSMLWVAAAQVAISTVPVPPPVYLPSHPFPTGAPRGSFRSVTFDVEVRGGGELLWSGPMRVSTDSGASVDRRQSDAPAERCPASERGGYGSSERDSLSINLSLRDGAVAVVAVRASWERRAEGGGCAGATRTVSFTENVPVAAPGSVKTIKGDGGLTMTLRQR